jgi:predicted Zn-dependent protease with MMP-like domain
MGDDDNEPDELDEGDEGDDSAPEETSEADARVADGLSSLWEAYRLDQAARGVTLGAKLVAEHPEHGELWFWYGCCLERCGDLRAADRAFMRGAKARTEPQRAPFRVSWRHFQHAVEAAGDALPARLRGTLEEVTVVLADYAEPVLLDGFDEPELLGLFAGSERGDLANPAADITPRIYLWRRAHEHSCSGRREFDEEVRQTLWHELGHYLGYDEHELDELGRG